MKNEEKKFLNYLIGIMEHCANSIKKLLSVKIMLLDNGSDEEDLELVNNKFESISTEAAILKQITSQVRSMMSGEFLDNYTENFDILSSYILESPLKAKEQVTLIFDFIECNIKLGELDPEQEVLKFDLYKLRGFNISKIEIMNLLEPGRLITLCNSPDEELTKREAYIKNKIIECSENGALKDLDNNKKLYKIVQDCYLSKKDSYELEDIKQVVTALKELKVMDELCDKVETTLTSQLNKRKAKQTAAKREIIPLIKPKTESKYISDSEYKQIRKEIATYCDMYTMQPVRQLTEEEAIYCASLMLKIGENPNLVRTLFDRNKVTEEIDNPISYYASNYEKFKFYQDKYNLTEHLDAINEYLAETFMATPDDTVFWKNGIQEELKQIEKLLPGTCDYELQKAKQYQKKATQTVNKK